MNVSRRFIDSLGNECKELGLVLFACALQSQFISNPIEKSQCEEFVKRGLSVNIDLLEDFLQNNIVNLSISVVIGLFRLKNIHDAFFVELVDIFQDFLVNLFG